MCAREDLGVNGWIGNVLVVRVPTVDPKSRLIRSIQRKKCRGMDLKARSSVLILSLRVKQVLHLISPSITTYPRIQDFIIF